MKRLLLILLIGIIFSGCIGLRSYNNLKTQFFDIKLNKQSKNINNLINIKGYYAIQKKNNNTVYFMFFEDGSYFNQVVLDKENNIVGFYSPIGFYKLYGDTIKIQMIDRGYGLTGSSFSEKWYKIIDKNTLKLIYGAQDQITDNYFAKYYLEEYNITKYYNSYARFIPLDSIPYFENTLKKDKFFWEDEKDWKEYMKNRKK